MKLTDVVFNVVLENHVHKRRRHLKDAIEIATQLANRGYYPKEAVDFATDSVKSTTGYEFTPEDIETILKFIPVHKNFS
jgi:hypothetical protein